MSYIISRLAPLALSLCVTLGAWALGTTMAQAQELKQIELNDKLVAAFIAAQKDFAPLASRLAEAGEEPDEALMKELEDIAKKHGFADFDEFEDVGANISIVLEGLNRSDGTYSDPIEKMKQELEEIKADETIPPEDKKLAVDDLTQEIAASEPLKYKGNIDVVKRHIADIEKLIPEEEMGESAPAP